MFISASSKSLTVKVPGSWPVCWGSDAVVMWMEATSRTGCLSHTTYDQFACVNLCICMDDGLYIKPEITKGVYLIRINLPCTQRKVILNIV